jgi:hypothetical protein
MYSSVSIDALPACYLLPRNHVAALIYVDHRVWLTKAARNAKPHRDSPRRAIHAKNIADGRGAWERLPIATTEIPLRVSPYCRGIVDESRWFQGRRFFGVVLTSTSPGSINQLRARYSSSPSLKYRKD